MECFILASRPISEKVGSLVPASAFVIAVDHGWQQAEQLNIKVDLIVGDFDSAPCPTNGIECIQLPKEKDDTDTFYAVRLAVEKGATKITILGGLGGRVDHTIANLQTLLYLAENKIENRLLDDTTDIQCFWPPQILKIQKQSSKYLSLFAADEKVRGLSLKGVKFPLEKAELDNNYPLGISNEFQATEAEISWQEGFLFLFLCEKDD